MKTDSIALAARGKVICQDSARHGSNYIIVADGCSSSPFSEVGAMLLALSARSLFENGYYFEDFGEVAILKARDACVMMGLPSAALDATLIIGYQINGQFTISVYGDGVVWYKDSTGNHIAAYETIAEKSSGSISLPYYLSYRFNKDRDRLFFEHEPMTLINGRKTDFCKKHTLYLESPAFVGIATDGVTQISNRVSKLDIVSVLEKFTDFPITEGAFLARRVWATVKKESWVLGDDFGMAVAICK